jgi:hypothetical protein
MRAVTPQKEDTLHTTVSSREWTEILVVKMNGDKAKIQSERIFVVRFAVV